MTVYTTGGSPYDLSETTTNSFYRSDHVVLTPIASSDRVVAPRSPEQAVIHFRGVDPPAVVAAGACTPAITTFPEWLTRFEIFKQHQATICELNDRR